MRRGRPGWASENGVIDEEFIEACNRVLVGWGFEGKGCYVDEQGVFKVQLSHPILCLEDGWLEKTMQLKKKVVVPWMRLADVNSFLAIVVSSYFGMVMCYLRDNADELQFASVKGPDEEKVIRRKTRRGRRADR